MSQLVMVPTGTGNVASVSAAFLRLGADLITAAGPDDVSDAAGVVLPGVGAFGAAMARVDALGLRPALRDRIEQGKPTLVVCVGMQLLCRDSEESPGTYGLGAIDLTVTRFEGPIRVPQLGWNRVEPGPGAKLLQPGWAYFANSYRMSQVPEGWEGASTEYGGQFVSALERGNILACQFHPELSGAWGASLLGRWLDTTREAA